jgi:hypothetical protein
MKKKEEKEEKRNQNPPVNMTMHKPDTALSFVPPVCTLSGGAPAPSAYPSVLCYIQSQSFNHPFVQYIQSRCVSSKKGNIPNRSNNGLIFEQV